MKLDIFLPYPLVQCFEHAVCLHAECFRVGMNYSVFTAGVWASQSIDAMALEYMAVTLTWVLFALRFVSPT